MQAATQVNGLVSLCVGLLSSKLTNKSTTVAMKFYPVLNDLNPRHRVELLDVNIIIA